MIFGFISIDGLKFWHVIKIHLNQVDKTIAIKFQVIITGIDSLIEHVDNFFLPVVCHNNNFQDICLWLLDNLLSWIIDNFQDIIIIDDSFVIPAQFNNCSIDNFLKHVIQVISCGFEHNKLLWKV